jgi:Methyltransferase domain
MATLETGTGASTIVFAASGTRHVAISPAPAEHEAIKVYCEEEGIELTRVRFVEQPSHLALLHNWQPEPLDVVLIDGAHRFPFPILDWFYTAPHLRKGGWVLVDDAFLGSVNVLVSFLRSEPSWSLERVFGGRTACFRKLADESEQYDWLDSAFDNRWKFDYLPPPSRIMASARHRLFQVGWVQTLVRRATVRRGR